MLDILAATAPIFLIVLLGYVLTSRGVFRRADTDVMSGFVMQVALPLLVFLNLAGRSTGEIINPAFLLTYALAALAMFGLAFAYARARGRTPVRAAFLGMAMGGTNNGFIGFPIFLILFPAVAGAAVGMAMLVDSAVVVPVTLLLAEYATGTGSWGSRLRATLRSVVTQPVVLAIAAALALNAFGLGIPSVLDRAMTLLAQTASGLALFTVGGLLVGLRPRGVMADILISVAAKLVVMPVVAIGVLAALAAVGLPALSPELRGAAILTCALPTYSMLPVLAAVYGETEVAAASLMLQVIASFFTITAWIAVLGGLGWT